jgi:hypothetical protein
MIEVQHDTLMSLKEPITKKRINYSSGMSSNNARKINKMLELLNKTIT